MAGLELLSDQGYRVDGRRAGELRKIQARMGVFAQADGSAYIEQGNTKALAVVYGPHEIRGSRARALPDRALVNCQYSSATFSTGERKRRPHGDRKSCEMGLQLRQTFEAAILTQLHPRSQIDIYVQVSRQQLSAWGGRGMGWGLGVRGQEPDTLMPLVGACWTPGYPCGTSCAWWPQLALALLPASGQLALLEMDARLHEDHLEQVLEAAARAARDVHTLLDRVVRQHVREASILLGD
uniref:Exosome component 4 n=1 Tax=Lynx canadensis TaxID=61383 RepID=A0A667HWB0_LYNCA